MSKRSEKNHGFSHLKEYNIWSLMKARCTKKYSESYKTHGARGISYCESWEKFINFYTDMGPIPSKRHQIDRIDVNGNYCKENCRWVTPDINAANRRRYTNCIGAYKKGKKYCSILGVDNKLYHIGTFETKKDAQIAYITNFKEWFGFYPNGSEELLNEI